MSQLDFSAVSANSGTSINKVVKNTYILLSATLFFSAIMAGVSIAVNPPAITSIVCSIGAMLVLWLVLPKFANSSKGIGIVFLVTGLLGFGLGPMLTRYLALPNGSELIATAFGGTAIIFLALSGYALTSKKDFSFMGGFLFAGFIMVLIASVANIFLHIPALSLAISAVMILIMSGYILYDTSKMVNGGETNYIYMTVNMYINIYLLFIHLLNILGVLGGDD